MAAAPSPSWRATRLVDAPDPVVDPIHHDQRDPRRRRPAGRGDGHAHRPGPDGGQALPVVAGALALVVVLALGAVRLAAVVTDRARAHSAADAAALAGAVEGREGAERLAEANGGEVRSWQASGDEVEVRVRVGDAEATARARLQPVTPPSPRPVP